MPSFTGFVVVKKTVEVLNLVGTAFFWHQDQAESYMRDLGENEHEVRKVEVKLVEGEIKPEQVSEMSAPPVVNDQDI